MVVPVPELSESYMDMAGKLFTFTSTFTARGGMTRVHGGYSISSLCQVEPRAFDLP